MKKLDQAGGTALFVMVFLVVLLGSGYYLYKQNIKDKTAHNYAECVAAGGLLQESYPEVCVIDGHNFTNPDQKLDSR
jgi:hypothetical protein